MLLEGSDGTRNNWYLDTFRGRTVDASPGAAPCEGGFICFTRTDTRRSWQLAKMVVKMYTTEAVASGVQDKIVEAQEMARTWLPERRAQDAVL